MHQPAALVGAPDSRSGTAAPATEDDLRARLRRPRRRGLEPGGVRRLARLRRDRPRAATRSAPAMPLVQDPDVLDTWFSSALWPHSTLGWPEETPELAKYYPTSVLSTARDIITLWVARMVIFGLFNRGDVPFRDVYHPPGHPGRPGQADVEVGGQRRRPGRHHRPLRRRRLAVTRWPPAPTETQDLRIPVEKPKLPDGRDRQHVRAVRAGAELRQQVLERRAVRPDEPGGLRAGAARPARRCRSRTAGSSTAWIARSREVTAGPRSSSSSPRRPGGSATSPGTTSATGTSSLSRAASRDPDARPIAQRVLAALLDGLCRLLHPIMPFVTEQVWQGLASWRPCAAPRSPSRRGERLHRGLAAAAGLVRRNGSADRRAVVRGDQGVARNGGLASSPTDGAKPAQAVKNMAAAEKTRMRFGMRLIRAAW